MTRSKLQHVDRRRSIHDGFTLIELLIVVLIVSLLAAVAVPKFAQSHQQMRVELAAQRIKADLLLAAQYAEKTSSSITVQFWTLPAKYQLMGVPDLDHPSSDYTLDLGGYPYNASIASVDFGGDALVIIDLHGIPDSGGSVTLEAGGYQKTVSIDGGTGRVGIL